MILIIGPQWQTERLRRSNDYVRMEIVEALSHDVLIVPVLLDGAEMPSPEELPDDVAAVAYHNAAPLRKDPDFHTDAGRLISAIEGTVGHAPPTKERQQEFASAAPPPTRFDRPPTGPTSSVPASPSMSRGWIYALVLLVAGGGAYFLFGRLFGFASPAAAIVLLVVGIWIVVDRRRLRRTS